MPSIPLDTRTRKFANAKTTVFWDVEDFPLPEGKDLVWFTNTLKSALVTSGYRGDVTIKAYGPEQEDTDVIRRYTDLGITYKPEDDKFWRVSKLILDILLGTKGHHRPPYLKPENLMVISRNTHHDITLFVSYLQELSAYVFNVLLVLPRDCQPELEPVPRIDSAWYWDSLLDADHKRIPTSELSQLVARGLNPMPMVRPSDDDDANATCPAATTT